MSKAEDSSTGSITISETHSIARPLTEPLTDPLYDLIVIGSGPGGHRASVQAAKLGKRVLVVERDRIGGACLHLGTIPSKALREAALNVPLHGQVSETLIHDVMTRTHDVIADEQDVTEKHFRRNGVEVASGTASFLDRSTIRIIGGETSEASGEKTDATRTVSGHVIVIATGTRPRRPKDLDFSKQTLFDSDSILTLKGQPRTMLVIGAGVIGCEYASIFARMGVQVTLIDSRELLLASMDREIVASLTKQFEKLGINLRLNTDFAKIEDVERQQGSHQALVELSCRGKKTSEFFDCVLYCLGRTGNFESLNIEAIGLDVDSRGQLKVDANYQTAIPNIYAVGDIIGAPALAASSSEQGRLAVLHAFNGEKAEFPEAFPYGIYTIPEISTVGIQEASLIERGIKYVVGKAPFPILARGKMLEDEFGFLKLLVHANTRRIVGVHVIGTSATELVHIGQVAMAFGATVDFFVDNVFNYPTLAEAYKVAAFNAENKLNELR